MRTRHMTLIEVILSLFLAAILLTALLSLYYQAHIIKKNLDQEFHEIEKRQYVRVRLNKMMKNILKSSGNQIHSFNKEEKINRNSNYFFVPSNSSFPSLSQELIFTHFHHTTSHSSMSSKILSRLYLDENERLCLLTWPMPKTKRTKREEIEDLEKRKPLKEILMENVKSFSLSFYDKFHLEEEKHQYNSWPFEKKNIPEYILFHISYCSNSGETKRQILKFACPLENPERLRINIKKRPS